MVRAGGALTGVSKRFSRRGPWVLKEIELELPAGSRTVIGKVDTPSHRSGGLQS